MASKKLIEPKKPAKPYMYPEPTKTIKVDTTLYYDSIGSFDSMNYSIVELLEISKAKDIPLNELRLVVKSDEESGYYDDSRFYVTIELRRCAEIENINYKKQLKEYNDKKQSFDKKMAKYKKALKEYKVKKAEFDKDIKKFQIEDMTKKLEKLKKEIEK